MIVQITAIKKIIPFIFCALLTSCAVQPRNRITNVMFLDYRPYLAADFHISPNSYTQPHNVLGELRVIVYPATKSMSQKTNEEQDSKFEDGIYGGGFSANRVYKELITSKELLETAVSQALLLGADGIANFEVKQVYNTTYLKSGEVIQSVSHYEVKGLCIDRL